MTNGSNSIASKTWRKSRSLFAILALAVCFSVTFYGVSAAYAQNLVVTYGSKGVQSLTYAGVTLEDQNAYPGDSFHIWHLRSTRNLNRGTTTST